jgi:hypothetical protein
MESKNGVIKKGSNSRKKGQTYINQEIKFQKKIDNWVYDKLSQNHQNFLSLVKSLPGIYPLEVLLSVKRLASSKKVDLKTYQKLFRDAKTTRKRTISDNGNSFLQPHPLDFEWRFTEKTIVNLVKYCLALSNPGNTICLFGVPSLYRLVGHNDLKRKFILFDKNPVEPFVTIDYCSSIPCDLRNYSINQNSIATTVLMDSPWYPEYNRAFLWNASKLCKENGFVLMVTPKEGTRPNIMDEWRDTLQFSNQNGLEYLGICSNSIIYDTPYFERNALMAAGIINFPLEWRCANLLIFRKIGIQKSSQPVVKISTEWHEESYFGIRVRKTIDSNIFTDPRLISIVPNDILPSVSRRDSRRELAFVWTHGNRIFGCKGPHILRQILSAMTVNESPFFNVESILERNLKEKENKLISITQQQIHDLVKKERAEQCLL